jgi:hypothetical protein
VQNHVVVIRDGLLLGSQEPRQVRNSVCNSHSLVDHFCFLLYLGFHSHCCAFVNISNLPIFLHRHASMGPSMPSVCNEALAYPSPLVLPSSLLTEEVPYFVQFFSCCSGQVVCFTSAVGAPFNFFLCTISCTRL